MSEEVFAALVAVAVGAILTLVPSEVKERLVRRQRRKSHWQAVSAEVELCREMAQVLLDDKVKAPLYRLPDLAYLNSFPALLAEGDLSEAETLAVTRFFSEVQTLNRGLDLATEMRQSGQVDAEYERNLMKAKTLVLFGGLLQSGAERRAPTEGLAIAGQFL